MTPENDKYQMTNQREVASKLSRQFTLFELIFLISTFAVGLAIYRNVSESLALLIAGGLMLVAFSRLYPPLNPIVGAVRGFLIAAGISGFLLVARSDSQSAIETALILSLPPVGYVVGLANSELLHWD